MNLNFSIKDDFSSSIDEQTGVSVFLDKVDNKSFEVRIGRIEESDSMGTITAESDEVLNSKVLSLLEAYLQNREMK